MDDAAANLFPQNTKDIEYLEFTAVWSQSSLLPWATASKVTSNQTDSLGAFIFCPIEILNGREVL